LFGEVSFKNINQTHGCRSNRIFGVAKYFIPKFPKLGQKVVVQIMQAVSWCALQKNGLNLFFCKRWAPYLKSNNGRRHFLNRFLGILPRCLGILFKFSGILPRFSGNLPKFSKSLHNFSTNQNVWGCPCTSAYYTTDQTAYMGAGCFDYTLLPILLYPTYTWT